MDNTLNNLGIAYKAKKVIFGEEVLLNIKDIKLVVIASDISNGSKKRIVSKCEYYGIKYIDKYSCDDISNALGKKNIKTIGIKDEGFAKLLSK